MLELPINLVEAVAITAPGFSGLLHHHRTNLPPSLMLEWSGTAYCFYLEGDNANRYFEVNNSTTKVRGLLIREPNIVVDVTSRYDTVKQWDAMGSLVLENGAVHIVGSPFGNGFVDPVRVPLWPTGFPSVAGESVGFFRWALGVEFDGSFREIWRQSSVVHEE